MALTKCFIAIGIIAGINVPLIDASCGKSSVQQKRIVYGYDSLPNAWPWMASIQKGSSHWCGATLVAPTWLVTSAHCLVGMYDISKWNVRLGAHDRTKQEDTVQIIGIRKVVSNPSYNQNYFFADIAMIELIKPAMINSKVAPICLPDQHVSPTRNQQCYIAGWGSVTHPALPTDILQQAPLPIVNSRYCRYQPEVICAGYGRSRKANGCRGDSGGPLMCKQSDGSWKLEGVMSYVVTYCKYFTAFSPVNKYVAWIQSHISGQR